MLNAFCNVAVNPHFSLPGSYMTLLEEVMLKKCLI
jgi:hypothetical protein